MTTVCGKKRLAMITLWFLYELMAVGENVGESRGAVRRNPAMML